MKLIHLLVTTLIFSLFLAPSANSVDVKNSAAVSRTVLRPVIYIKKVSKKVQTRDTAGVSLASQVN